MDYLLKTKIITALKRLIKNIELGKCDNMTTEQYEKLIECLNIIVEIETNKSKCIWNFGK